MTGFLEESAGVKSSTRLYALLLIITGCVVALGLLAYILISRKDASAAVITAGIGIITALVASGAVAIIKRGTGE